MGKIIRRSSTLFLVMVAALIWMVEHSPVARAQGQTELISQRIAESLIGLRGKGSRYKTIAFSQVEVVGAADIDIDEVIDYSTTKILQTVLELDVVNRAQLQRILKEQKFQLSDFVSADEYKELGKLAGVDLFIYGTLYSDALILKAIDVQTSIIAWADVFFVDTIQSDQKQFLTQLGRGIVESMKENPRLERAKIKTVSFWDFKTNTDISADEFIDFLTVHITREGSFKVVDRNNLKLILGEQSLNQEIYFDEQSAADLGGLFGVQAFINGNIKQDGPGIVADLKMTEIHTGKFVWAAIIRAGEEQEADPQKSTTARRPRRSAPPGMKLVKEGVFVMGTNSTPRDAKPAFQIDLPAFHIDANEVSNRKYMDFVNERSHRAPVGWVNGRYRSGTADLPVSGVTWDDARDYCRFRGLRLPSEAEWEKAARGSAGQIYPWQGSNFAPSFTVTRESGKKIPLNVNTAAKDVSPYGIKHMAGNVREWVNDVYKRYPGSTADNAKFNKERVVRGGSWAQKQQSALTYYRGSSSRNLAWPDVGFRCAKSASVPGSR